MFTDISGGPLCYIDISSTEHIGPPEKSIKHLSMFGRCNKAHKAPGDVNEAQRAPRDVNEAHRAPFQNFKISEFRNSPKSRIRKINNVGTQ